MTDKTKILAEIERLKMNWRLGMSAEAKYRVEAYTELIDFINSIPEEPVSEDLQEAAWFYADKKACLDKSIFTQKEINEKRSKLEYNWEDIRTAFKAGAQWQKSHLWKGAYGDDLPEYDREVIAILDYDFGHYKVAYAHRPNPNGWNGTNIDTEENEIKNNQIKIKINL